MYSGGVLVVLTGGDGGVPFAISCGGGWAPGDVMTEVAEELARTQLMLLQYTQLFLELKLNPAPPLSAGQVAHLPEQISALQSSIAAAAEPRRKLTVGLADDFRSASTPSRIAAGMHDPAEAASDATIGPASATNHAVSPLFM